MSRSGMGAGFLLSRPHSRASSDETRPTFSGKDGICEEILARFAARVGEVLGARSKGRALRELSEPLCPRRVHKRVLLRSDVFVVLVFRRRDFAPKSFEKFSWTPPMPLFRFESSLSVAKRYDLWMRPFAAEFCELWELPSMEPRAERVRITRGFLLLAAVFVRPKRERFAA